MRLSSIRPHVAKLALIHPATQEPVGITLHIVGKDSPNFKQLMREFVTQRAAVEASGGKIDVEELGRRVITTCVVGCDEEDAFEGPYTPEKLDELLKTGEYDWVAEQVNEFVNKRESFF